MIKNNRGFSVQQHGMKQYNQPMKKKKMMLRKPAPSDETRPQYDTEIQNAFSLNNCNRRALTQRKCLQC